MDGLKGYKTIIFNVIMGVAALWNQVAGTDIEPTGLIDAMTSLEGAIVEIWVVGNTWLRAITNSPIFKKNS